MPLRVSFSGLWFFFFKKNQYRPSPLTKTRLSYPHNSILLHKNEAAHPFSSFQASPISFALFFFFFKKKKENQKNHWKSSIQPSVKGLAGPCGFEKPSWPAITDKLRPQQKQTRKKVQERHEKSHETCVLSFQFFFFIVFLKIKKTPLWGSSNALRVASQVVLSRCSFHTLRKMINSKKILHTHTSASKQSPRASNTSRTGTFRPFKSMQFLFFFAYHIFSPSY